MNLEQLRKQAKDRLRERRRTDPQAKLMGEQHALARELGFPSWQRMKAYLERDAAVQAFHADLDYYEGRAYGLLEGVRDGTPAAVAAFGGAPHTMAGARTVVARAHGFPSWPQLRRHVGRLSDSGEPFAAAYRAVEAHDPDTLRTVLERWPEVVQLRGTNGNDLVAMATATCDDRTVQLLLDAGADPNQQNAHGWTAMHQIAYANATHLVPMLLAAGGRTDVFGRGDGGTPLVAALFWGNVEVADLFVQVGGVQPRNLRAAAGAGDVGLLRSLLGTPEAGAHRGFYRPHSGFPHWTPSDDPQEVLDEALSWAARSGRVAAIDALAAAGARLDADIYRGTALTWAASEGQTAAVARLLELGANADRRGTYGGESHGQDITALNFATKPEIARLLLEAGASPTRYDGLGYGPPAGWARHSGHDDVARVIEAEVVVSEADPAAARAITAIQSGDVESLRAVLAKHPEFAYGRFVRNRDGSRRTLLHVATDWPGHFGNAREVVAALVEHRADVNARIIGPTEETPLHWAASTDDVDALAALLDAGADIEAAGGHIEGGPPLENARVFKQWDVARLLVEHGANTTLPDEAALGLTDRVQHRFAEGEPGADDVAAAFWNACHGGQREVTEFLLGHGADPNHAPAWAPHSPLEAAAAENPELASWLRERGAV